MCGLALTPFHKATTHLCQASLRQESFPGNAGPVLSSVWSPWASGEKDNVSGLALCLRACRMWETLQATVKPLPRCLAIITLLPTTAQNLEVRRPGQVCSRVHHADGRSSQAGLLGSVCLSHWFQFLALSHYETVGMGYVAVI